MAFICKDKAGYVMNVLEECLEVAYRGGSAETQERIERAVDYLSNLKFKVKVEVRGGVAEVTKCPKQVSVEIKDWDNEK